MTTKRSRLNEMDYMRPIVIVLLVMMHSFSMYAGGWDYPDGIGSVLAYKWIQVFSYGCMLEAFTFISGYLFGFQLKNKKTTFGLLVRSKFKRLMIPSLIFGILYAVLFKIDWCGINNWYSIIFNIIIGIGHLWYLPMLFLCFIASWLINKIQVDESIKLFFLFVLSIFAVLPIPLGINSMLHYLPFFYLGIYFFNNAPNLKLRGSLICMLLFMVLLFVVSFYRQTHTELMAWQKVLFWYLKQLYASLGTIGIFGLCKMIGKKRSVSAALMEFNSNSFGIYIFHQFLLVFFYYYTSIPLFLGTYLLPWFGLFAAFGLSWLFTYLLRKLKIGRLLFG